MAANSFGSHEILGVDSEESSGRPGGSPTISSGQPQENTRKQKLDRKSFRTMPFELQRRWEKKKHRTKPSVDSKGNMR